MTTLTVDLSPTLSSTLAHSGVYAYAVYFNSVTGDDPQGVVLVNNGAVVSGGSVSFDLPTPFASGKVTFIIQSLELGTASDLFTISDNLITGGGTVTSQGQIDWGPAQQNDYRFDSFEVSLTPNAADTGDLTEINGFGIPMEVSVVYSGGTSQTRGYNLDGATIFQDIKDVSSNLTGFTYSAGPLSGSNRMALSPAEAEKESLPGASPTDWEPYVTALESVASSIKIAGYFNGAYSDDVFFVGTTALPQQGLSQRGVLLLRPELCRHGRPGRLFPAHA